MGIIKRTLRLTTYGTVASAGAFFFATRKDVFVPMSTADPIFQHRLYPKLNPSDNPTMHDLCIRRVPITDIKPSLLEQKGKLVETFSAGMWSGWGYSIQRIILAKLFYGPETASQLWSREELRASDYNVGTLATDHLEVIDKTADAIVLRVGDTPRNQDVRGLDGFLEVSAVAKEGEGVVELGFKTCFFQGLPGGKPFPAPIVWLHQLYVKLLVETAVSSLTC